MRLVFPTGEVFATGSAPASVRPAVRLDRFTRVIVEVGIDEFTTTAVVDTGGVYLVLNPEFGKAVGLRPTNAIGVERLSVRGLVHTGRLHRIPLTISAESGEPLHFEATAFVPDLREGEQWLLPNYLGWQGCLDRIRLAIDPGDERVYFGALG